MTKRVMTVIDLLIVSPLALCHYSSKSIESPVDYQIQAQKRSPILQTTERCGP